MTKKDLIKYLDNYLEGKYDKEEFVKNNPDYKNTDFDKDPDIIFHMMNGSTITIIDDDIESALHEFENGEHSYICLEIEKGWAHIPCSSICYITEEKDTTI